MQRKDTGMGRLKYDRTRDTYAGPGLIIAGSVVRRVMARRVAEGLPAEDARARTLQSGYWMLLGTDPAPQLGSAGVA